MRLDQIFKNDFLIENLSSNSKKDVFVELINVLINSGLKIDKARAIDVLQQREKLGSTGIGDGVAIPHGQPVHLFFLLLAPENSTGQHLKALAKISKMLKSPNFRKKLIEAKTKSDLYEAIVEQDESCPV